MKNWKVPGLFLMVLLVLFVFRWGAEGSVNHNGVIVNIKIDRWSGTIWEYQYDTGIRTENDNNPFMKYAKQPDTILIKKIIEPPKVSWLSTENLTLTWNIATPTIVLWLLSAGVITPIFNRKVKVM